MSGEVLLAGLAVVLVMVIDSALQWSSIRSLRQGVADADGKAEAARRSLRYGIGQQAVQKIASRKRWSHLG